MENFFQKTTSDYPTEELFWDRLLTSNQIKEFTRPDASVVSFGYDLTGARTSRSDAGRTDQYEYDVRDRLLDLNFQTPADPAARGNYLYSYDARTRRVSRTELGTPTISSFQGGLAVQEYAASPGTAPGSLPAATVEYVRGPGMGGGVGGMYYSVRGGAASLSHGNVRGDVVAKVDEATSAITWEAQYEAYGKRPVESGTNPDRQRANTKEEDPTGLLNEGFRYRDLETGAFITRDPAGFVDGPNLYTYVRQNPWTMFDPEGLNIDDKTHRVEEREVVDPGPMPKRNQYPSKAEHKAAKKAWETAKNVAKENAKFNRQHKSEIRAWENYDRAITMMEGSKEGMALLEELRSDRYDIVVEFTTKVVLPDGNILVVPLNGGRVVPKGKKDGVSSSTVAISPSVMALVDSQFEETGAPNPDMYAYGVVFHELYHNDDSRDAYGTFDPSDMVNKTKLGVALPREARATRFENIIRYRNGGKIIVNTYDKGGARELKVDNPLGNLR